MSEEAWHRWGKDDERGALNFVTAGAVRAATALVRTGRVIGLSQPLSDRTPVPLSRGRVMRLMNRDGGDYAAGARRPDGFQFAEDTLVLASHTGTHIDALCHVWYDDALYNGFPSSSIRSTTGAAHCGVDKLGGIVTTGVLVDLMALRGRPLDAGEAVSAADLEGWLDPQTRARLRGAAVLVRTGWFETRGRDACYFEGEPGIDVSAGIWLAEAGVAVIGADNYAIEPIPFPPGQIFPLHKRLLRDYGVPLLEGLRLDELAASGATSFLFVAVPLPIAGGTASPIAPVAVL